MDVSAIMTIPPPGFVNDRRHSISSVIQREHQKGFKARQCEFSIDMADLEFDFLFLRQNGQPAGFPALQLHPDSYSVHRNIGQIFLEVEDIDEETLLRLLMEHTDLNRSRSHGLKGVLVIEESQQVRDDCRGDIRVLKVPGNVDDLPFP